MATAACSHPRARRVSSISIPDVDAGCRVPTTSASSSRSSGASAAPHLTLTTIDRVAELTGGRLVGAVGASQVHLHDVTHDSRATGPGVLFACRPGAVTDGHDFAADAVGRGSPALLVERELALQVPQVQVESVAQRLGAVAAAVHGHPSERLAVAGVTGTNGKTTSAMLLEAVLGAAGMRTGVIGTVGTRSGAREIPGVRTTPESTDLQRLFRQMLTDGVQAVAMEVSSHGLHLGRLNGTRFAVVAFTNLTHDHLDFHHTMEAYFAAKAQLFTPGFSPAGVINVDDPWGARLASQAQIPITTVSSGGAPAADVVATDVRTSATGSAVTVRIRGRSFQVEVGLPGRFNVSNALLVLAASDVLGIETAVAAEALRTPPLVPGRMERVDEGQPFTVLVDYAHTPDSLQRVLEATREMTGGGRVIVVVGCGGERDRQKRPAMGAAAAAGADLAIFTNDNPRSEEPDVILEAIAQGARTVTDGQWSIEPDRRTAIQQALRTAGPGDAVVIAGKGHETGQQLGDRTIAFDDREVARTLLRDGTGQ